MKRDFGFKETVIDGISYVCPTWDEMGKVAFEISKEINEKFNGFNRLIALARGGWTWSRALIDQLNIPNLSSIRVKSYEGINLNSEIKLIQPLSDLINGENILILDDVVDSGETLKFAKNYVIGAGAKKVMTAALCFKPRSVFIPDFYGFETKSWVIFPHEWNEFTKQVLRDWKIKGVSDEEIKNRLKEIGLPIEQVNYFLPRIVSEIE